MFFFKLQLKYFSITYIIELKEIYHKKAVELCVLLG